jgi:ABC-type dipeptide/oligopeptide/nickel transport system permease component
MAYFLTLSKKLGQFVLSILCASLVVFFIVQLTPGDMAEIHSLSPNTARSLHLDQSWIVQYLFWLRDCLSLDFRMSLTDGTPVLKLLGNLFPAGFTPHFHTHCHLSGHSS